MEMKETRTGPERSRGDILFSRLIASRPPRQAGAAAGATFASLVFHAAVVGAAVWGTWALADQPKDEEDQVTYIQVEEESPLPPPPPPPEVAPPPPEVTDVPKGFQTLALPEVIPPEIPPPGSFEAKESDFSGEGMEGGRAEGRVMDLETAPVITPYTVAPELKNREAVLRALQRLYPPMLRDAGVGGRVVVWVFIDDNGKVLKSQIKTGSGFEAFDEAALKVANLMQFSPAINMDKRVKVWVQIPITFTSK